MKITEKLKLIEELRSKVIELIPGKDWDDNFLRKIKLDFTYHSNKLEGNTLTYGQTIKLLRDLVTPKNALPGELLDMVNHHKVLDAVFLNYRSQTISEENIKELHRQLMKDIDQWGDDGLYSPGQYKSFENMTVRSNGKIHNYLPPAQVEKAMQVLIRETNEALKSFDTSNIDKHPLTIATHFHQEFLNTIHPFSDGNGRIARMIMNIVLLKSGYAPVFIKEVARQEYLSRFEFSNSEINPMLDFMADRLIESLEEKLEFFKVQK
jgi:Fic family protein